MRPSGRTALRYGGIVVATIIVFVVALQLSFPYDRVKTKITDALSEKYDVTIGGIERSWVPGRFALTAVSLRNRPVKVGDPVTTFYIERLDIDFHFLAALHGTASVDLDAKIGQGHIAGNVAFSKSNYSVHLDGKQLPGESLPMRELMGLPMSGRIEFEVALDLPVEANKAGKRAPDWSLADGEIDFSCPSGCVIGDGKTKLKPKLKNARSAAFAADGIEFGKVEIQSLFAEISITAGPGDGKPGKLQLKRFEVKSLDGEVKIDFGMQVMPDINDSPVAGCLRFKGSEVLNKREPMTFAELQTTGAQLGPDGLFHIKLTDKFRDIQRKPQTCGPDAPPDGLTGEPRPQPGTPNTVRRPNLTVAPPPAPPPTTREVAPPPSPPSGTALPPPPSNQPPPPHDQQPPPGQASDTGAPPPAPGSEGDAPTPGGPPPGDPQQQPPPPNQIP